MSEYIRREDAMKNVKILCVFHHAGLRHQDVMDAITKIPSADVRENLKGEWIIDDTEEYRGIHCSECGKSIPYGNVMMGYNYCPNCGADMR